MAGSAADGARDVFEALRYRAVMEQGASKVGEIPAGFTGAFSSTTRSRGAAYARRGMVTNLEVESDGVVSAEVEGSSDYSVWMFFEAMRRRVVIDCDCPVAARGELCKHAWATLRELADEGWLLRLRPGGGAGWTAGAGEMGFARDNASAILLPVSGESATVTLDDNRPFTDELETSTPLTPVAALGWMDRLDHAQDRASRSSAGRAERSWEKPREYLYALVPVEGEGGESRLGVSVCSRVPGSRRVRGETPAMCPRPTDRPVDPADARALAALRGAARAEAGDDWRYQELNPELTTLPAALASTVLEAVCATGRCYLAQGGAPDDGPRVVWDGPAAWSAVLRLKGEPGADPLRLEAELVRGDEVLDVDASGARVKEAIFYPAPQPRSDGALLMAPLDDGGATGWLEQLGGERAVAVPADDVGALMSRLFGRAGVPPLRLPDHLAVTDETGPPVGVLRLLRPDDAATRVPGWAATRSRAARPEPVAEVAFGYGDETVSAGDPRTGVFVAETQTLFRRGMELEAELVREAGRWGEGLGRYGADGPDGDDCELVALDPTRLAEAVERLTAEGWRVEADDRPVRVSRGDFSISVSSGIDWFDVKGEAAFGDQTLGLDDLLGAVKTGERFVTLGDGSRAVLPEAWLKRYAPLAELGEEEEGGRRLRAGQVGLLDALLEAMPEARFDKQVAAARRELRKLGDVKPKAAPRGFVGELRDYQKTGLGWMTALAKLGLNGCLADDMGLGKTIQVLAWLEARRAGRGRRGDEAARAALVVVQRSLIDNWRGEATKFAPKLKVRDHTGPRRWDDAAAGTDRESTAVLDESDLVLTTYGTLRRDAPRLAGHDFDAVVLDEAQAIKNPKTAAAKAARLLRAPHRLAVSGTPVENHLGELVSVFDFLNPGMLDGATGLLERAAALEAAGRQDLDEGALAERAAADRTEMDAARVLSRAVSPFVLRRTKAQVAPELPARQEETLWCEMEPKQQRFYDRLAAQYRASLMKKIELNGLKRSKIQVLEALLRLRQAACDPWLVDAKQGKLPSAKLDVLVERLLLLREQGSKALVFSQFVKLLGRLRERLDAAGVPYAYLDGRTRKRQAVVDQFQNDADCPLMLISLKAGGTGLNLTAAEYVFLLDPWWNPAVEAQAIDRAHRIGQTQTVFASRLITRGTVEEKVLELQASKRELADAILGDPASVMKTLRVEDLEGLLG